MTIVLDNGSSSHSPSARKVIPLLFRQEGTLRADPLVQSFVKVRHRNRARTAPFIVRMESALTPREFDDGNN